MLRLALLSILAFVPLISPAQESGALAGRVEGDAYISATGAFRMPIPVDQALGGSLSDTSNIVMFKDNFSTYITIVAKPLDATDRWELSTEGVKGYLVKFLKGTLFPDFQRVDKESKLESVLFAPTMFDGSLIAYVLLPGGSMFAARQPLDGAEAKVPVAKRGNLVFIKNGFIYVISTELAERVVEGSAYTKTTEEENVLLRERLSDIVHSITFMPVSHDAVTP
jgi:hypothetical protein